MKKNWNQQWICYPTPAFERPGMDRMEKTVSLPYDDNIRYEQVKENGTGFAGGFYPGCTAEYEKQLVVPSQWQDKKVSLKFDGVYHNAVVYVNKQFAARCNYGYSAFECDLTPYLHQGENVIHVSALNGDVPNSRWYTGTGIYRDVELWVQPKVHIPWRGVHLTTTQAGADALVAARIQVANATAIAAERLVQVAITSPKGEMAAKSLAAVKIPAGETAMAVCNLQIAAPSWWSDETPDLYQVQVSLLDDSQITDEQTISFGLRTITVDVEHGLRINGKVVKLRGGCIHHDNGLIGAASHEAAERHKVQCLKAAGYNAIRSAHNPASDALLRVCDELGMYVLDEAFDMWREPKKLYDNSAYFEKNWQFDVTSMVERDFNHASVILYSTGNEVPERDGHSEGARINAELTAFIRSLDATRPVTHALCNVTPEGLNGTDANQAASDDNYFATVTAGVAEPLDVVGYNYLPERFEKDHERFPKRIFCATETVNSDLPNGWDKVLKLPYVIGDFVWAAIDYIGEAGIGRTVIGDAAPFSMKDMYRLSGSGTLDVTYRMKPGAYFRKCVWGFSDRPYIAVQDPALHDETIKPSWWGWMPVHESWHYPTAEGKPVHIEVYSQGEKVELYLNGKLIGSGAAGSAAGYITPFETVYAPGELKAVEYLKDGTTRSHTIRTPKDTRKMTLTTDCNALRADDDLTYIHIQITDEAGIPVLSEEHRVQLLVTGGAEIVGAGNTDIKTTENYTTTTPITYEGHLAVVLRSNGDHTPVQLRCICDELPEASITIPVE